MAGVPGGGQPLQLGPACAGCALEGGRAEKPKWQGPNLTQHRATSMSRARLSEGLQQSLGWGRRLRRGDCRLCCPRVALPAGTAPLPCLLLPPQGHNSAPGPPTFPPQWPPSHPLPPPKQLCSLHGRQPHPHPTDSAKSPRRGERGGQGRSWSKAIQCLCWQRLKRRTETPAPEGERAAPGLRGSRRRRGGGGGLSTSDGGRDLEAGQILPLHRLIPKAAHYSRKVGALPRSSA